MSVTVNGITYVSVPEFVNGTCEGCAANGPNNARLEAALCTFGSCVSDKSIWIPMAESASIKSILTRVRPHVEALTKITDMPSGEDLQLLKDIDTVLEGLK